LPHCAALNPAQAQLQKLNSEREDIVASAAPSIARAGELTAAVALAQAQVRLKENRRFFIICA